MKSPLNFFKYWKKHGWKKTWTQFKHNYYTLQDPVNIFDQKIFARMGQILFLGLLLITLALNGLWLWWGFLIFVLFAQFIELRQELAHRNKLKEDFKKLEEMYKEDKDGV